MATAERSVELAPTPASASAGRRLVRHVLQECAREQWRDAAELAISEIIANGILHAHSRLRLTVRCGPDELRVEVADDNPAMPAQRDYGERATTGRGMTLVAAVTSRHGVTVLETGKAVWFTVTDQQVEPHAEDLLAAWGDEPDVAPAPAGRRAVLLGLPPTLWLAAGEHHDALLRELALYRHGRGAGVDDLEVADRARAGIRTRLDRVLAQALAQGLARSPLPADHPARLAEVPALIDLEIELAGHDPAADFAVLQDVLDEAERLAAAGELLARPGLPEVVALRDWFAESVIAQLAGQPPSPWPGAAAPRFVEHLDHRAHEVDWDGAAVRDADRGVVAADDENRILAISRPLADLLGWTPEDLVGRRVVAIVPPRFREAHVAGFTRHLTTGEAHAIGVRLELPVLCADATEIGCEFLIEEQRSDSGRVIYVAWVSPLPG